jgi:RNA polymerase sigma-70 factor, ECF subfamily
MMDNGQVRVPAATDVGTRVIQDPRSFEEFFEGTHRRLFGALCLVTDDRDEAEEIMQDAYLKIWERWERVAAMDEPTGFLFRTAMNLFRSRYRRTLVALRRTGAPTPTTDDLAVVEDRDEVVRALSELTPAQRAAVVMTSMFGFSSEEAARMLGTKPSTVRAHAARARADVRSNMGERP